MYLYMCQLRESNNASEHLADNKDILSGRHDPNALKVRWYCHISSLLPYFCFALESWCLTILNVFLIQQEHLLKMTTLHRTEMAVKRGKPTSVEEGKIVALDFFSTSVASFFGNTFRSYCKNCQKMLFMGFVFVFR